jgi:hypothetical protein
VGLQQEEGACWDYRVPERGGGRLFGDLVFLDLVQQLLWLTALEMSSHWLQDAVEGLSHSRLQIARMDSARAVVALETLRISVSYSFLEISFIGDQEKCRKVRGEVGRLTPLEEMVISPKYPRTMW